MTSENETSCFAVDRVLSHSLSYKFRCFGIKLSNDKIIDYRSSNITMEVRFFLPRVFHKISAIKEFSDVSSNILAYKESASWMIELILGYIEDHII